jgi:hypothetical protein
MALLIQTERLARMLPLGAWGLLIGGCGDALVDDSFAGQSLWQITGNTDTRAVQIDGFDHVRLALFWNPKGEVGTSPTELVEQRAASMSTPLAAPFLLNMYQLPGAEHIARTATGLSRGFGVARLLAYLDRDQDGKYSVVDSFIGVLPNRVFAYVPAELPAWASPTSSVMPAGLYPLALPQRCDAAVIPTPTDAGSCGVKIGASCKQDSGCGANGVCLRETDVPWPTGYCTVADSATTSCRPAQASYYGVPRYGLSPSDVKGYYLQICQYDADCEKPGLRNSGLYVCDEGLRACVPNEGGKLPIGDTPMLEPFCIGGS